MLRGIPSSFLRDPQLRQLFNRTGFAAPQEYELAYIRRSRLWPVFTTLTESRVGNPYHECTDLAVSANTLGILYYFVRMDECIALERLRSVTEFGGGYGGACRVVLELLRTSPTYTIIDLPEILAFQYVFLRASLPDRTMNPVTVYTPATNHGVVKEGAINLVPSHQAFSLGLTGDLFFSTMAVTEAPLEVQKWVEESRFFDARAVYMVGQHVERDAWRSFDFAPADSLRGYAATAFPSVRLQEFHYGDAWELTASSTALSREPDSTA